MSARGPRGAAVCVVAHAAAGRCVDPANALALPFAPPAGSVLLSENALRRMLGLPAPGPQPSAAPYAIDELARLSGLSDGVCRALLLFDVIAPGGGPLTYPDLATARQVAHLLGQGLGLAPIVAAAASLGQRGLRVSQVRLAEAPWGEIVQREGGGLARLDGQFALVLDEAAGGAEDAFAQGLAAEEEGDLEAAERCYARAEQRDRRDAVIPFNRGNVLAALGRPAEAMIAYRHALDRDRSLAEASFNLARLYEAACQPDQALAWYQTAMATHPSYAQALYNAARLLTTARLFKAASPLWERFIALAPDDPDIGHARRLALLCRLERR